MRSAFLVPLNERLEWRPAPPIEKAATGTTPDYPSRKKKTRPLVGRRPGEKLMPREQLHFFISEIKCSLHTMKLRKMEKAEMPDPKLIFVTSPLEAIQKTNNNNAKGGWDILGFRIKDKDNNGKDKKADSGPSLSSSNYPSTSACKDTMRPYWGKETVHFYIRTHFQSGEAINLSTALLHFSLRDNKTTMLIGSHALNLSKLILSSRGNPRGGKQQVNNPNAGLGRPGGGGGGVGVDGGSESGNKSFNFCAPSAAFRSAGSSDGINEHVKNAALAITGKADPNSLLFGGSGRAAMLARKAGTTLMVKDTTSVNAQIRKMNLMSLKLDEPLYGGGLEVGRLKCCIDIWWTSSDEL
jgi:hypothetical protein